MRRLAGLLLAALLLKGWLAQGLGCGLHSSSLAAAVVLPLPEPPAWSSPQLKVRAGLNPLEPSLLLPDAKNKGISVCFQKSEKEMIDSALLFNAT